MNSSWKYGKCKEEKLMQTIYSEEYTYYIAYLTDRFLSGKCSLEALNLIEVQKLLEIRLISRTKENMARRTVIGVDHLFQWRVASEEGLSSKEYLVSYQTLDIDREHMRRLWNGNFCLMTTGGGTYELPLEDEKQNSVKVISYISYDEDGMAHIYDNRLAEFVKAEEA